MDLSALAVRFAPAELLQLAEQLEAGTARLSHGPERLALRGLPAGWAPALAALAAAGLSEHSAAHTLRALHAARHTGPRLEVISTQPEGAAALLTGAAHSLQSLLIHARHRVLLAGYRITDVQVLEPLVRHADRPIQLDLFLDVPADEADPALSPAARAAAWYRAWCARCLPRGLPAPRAWYAPAQVSPGADAPYLKMHIKSVVVDEHTWFVSSANFTHHGLRHNFELGAKVEDATACGQVRAHFEHLCEAGVFVPFGG